VHFGLNAHLFGHLAGHNSSSVNENLRTLKKSKLSEKLLDCLRIVHDIPANFDNCKYFHLKYKLK